MQLRPYQAAAVDALRAAFASGKKRVLLVSSTGTGKTQMFVSAAQSALAKGNSVLILACQKELIDQPSRKLDALGIDHGIIMAGHPRVKPWLPIQVASVPTLNRRGVRPPANVVILDEAHMANAKTLSSLLACYPDAAIIGCTATPLRLDGRGLGEIFQGIVEAITFREAVEQGYLVPVRTFAPPGIDVSAVGTSHGDFKQDELAAAVDQPRLVANIVETWVQYASGRPTLCFATGIAHSKHLTERFRAAGIEAAHIDGTTPPDQRAALLRDLASGRIRVLCNAQLLTFGVDIPEVSAIVQARPTMSLTVSLQQIGRGTRPSPGKDDLVVLDHANNVERHGLASDDREWSLEGRPKKKASLAVRNCPQCYAVLPVSCRKCPECGLALVALSIADPPVEARGELREVGPSVKSTHADKTLYWEYLEGVRKREGYAPGWSNVRFKARFGVWPVGVLNDEEKAERKSNFWSKKKAMAAAAGVPLRDFMRGARR